MFPQLTLLCEIALELFDLGPWLLGVAFGPFVLIYFLSLFFLFTLGFKTGLTLGGLIGL